jgi:Pirin-related protein
MIVKRLAEDRTHLDIKWLRSWATFTYSPYIDPELNSYHDLLKLDDEILAPGGGFDRHPHTHTEMFHYILSGELVHHNDGGTINVLKAGDIQRVSAGVGIVHTTTNPSPNQDTHFLQFWINPRRHTQESAIDVINVTPEEKKNRLRLIVSQDGVDGSLSIQQDTQIHLATIDQGVSLPFPLAPGRRAFLYVIAGSVMLNGTTINQGDSAGIEDEPIIKLKGISQEPAEILLWTLR